MENTANVKCLDSNATSIWKFVSCGTLVRGNGLEKEPVMFMGQNISVGFWVR